MHDLLQFQLSPRYRIQQIMVIEIFLEREREREREREKLVDSQKQ